MLDGGARALPGVHRLASRTRPRLLVAPAGLTLCQVAVGSNAAGGETGCLRGLQLCREHALSNDGTLQAASAAAEVRRAGLRRSPGLPPLPAVRRGSTHVGQPELVMPEPRQNARARGPGL